MININLKKEYFIDSLYNSTYNKYYNLFHIRNDNSLTCIENFRAYLAKTNLLQFYKH